MSLPVTAGRRPLVLVATLVAGVVATAWALRIEPGAAAFYWGTLLMAAIWTAGALACGPVRLTGDRPRPEGTPHPAVQGLLAGVLLLALFLVGAFVVAGIPVLAEPVEGLLAHADAGWLPLVALVTAVNGVAEEIFFRGALFGAVRRHAVVVTTLVYAAVTIAGGVPLLVLAGLLLGLVVGMQRHVTGGVVAPIVTHLVWSIGMLFLLPPTLDLAARAWGA